MTVSASNVSVTSGAVPLWTLKSTAILTTGSSTSYNWRIVRSGNGTVYAQSGDVISTVADCAVSGAWWVMEGKGVVDGGTTYKRQLCVQTNGTGGCRIKVSPRAGFTGGSPSASRVPSATDERVWHGGGTDASPTYASLFPTSAAWLQGEFSEADDFFYLLSYPVGGGPCNGIMLLGTVPALYDATGALYDKDPAVYYARSGSTAALASSIASEVNGPLALLGYLSAGGTDAWVCVPAALRCAYDSSAALQPTIPGGLPQSPAFAGAVYAQDTLRMGRRSAVAGTTTNAQESGNLNTCGDKGEELRVRYSGRLHTVPTLLNAVDPQSGLTTSGCLLAIGNLVLPYAAGVAVTDGA